MHDTREAANRFDHYCYGVGLWEMLANELLCSSYRYTRLDFPVPMGPEACPDHLVDPPEHMRGGWRVHHELDLAVHPDRGTVLLQACFRPPGVSDDGTWILGRHAAERLDEMNAVGDKLEAAFRAGGWEGPIPLARGLVLPNAERADIRCTEGFSEAAVITRDELPALESRLNAALKEQISHEARRGAAALEQLVDSDDSPVGYAFRHEAQLASYVDMGPCYTDDAVVDIAPEAYRCEMMPGYFDPESVVDGLPQTRRFDVEAFRAELERRADAARTKAAERERGDRNLAAG